MMERQAEGIGEVRRWHAFARRTMPKIGRGFAKLVNLVSLSGTEKPGTVMVCHLLG